MSSIDPHTNPGAGTLPGAGGNAGTSSQEQVNTFMRILNTLKAEGYNVQVDSERVDTENGDNVNNSNSIYVQDPQTGETYELTAVITMPNPNDTQAGSPGLDPPNQTQASGDKGTQNPFMEISFTAVLMSILALVEGDSLKEQLKSLLDQAKTNMDSFNASTSMGKYDQANYNLQASDYRSQARTCFLQAGLSLGSAVASVGISAGASNKYESDLEKMENNPKVTDEQTENYVKSSENVDKAQANYEDAYKAAATDGDRPVEIPSEEPGEPPEKTNMKELHSKIAQEKQNVEDSEAALKEAKANGEDTTEHEANLKSSKNRLNTLTKTRSQALNKDPKVQEAQKAYTTAKTAFKNFKPQPGLQQLKNYQTRLEAEHDSSGPDVKVTSGEPTDPNEAKKAAIGKAINKKETEITRFKDPRVKAEEVSNRNQLLMSLNQSMTQALNNVFDGNQKMISANFLTQEGAQKFFQDQMQGLQTILSSLATTEGQTAQTFGDIFSALLDTEKSIQQSTTQNFIQGAN
jgi:hypothetical protein